MLRYRIMNRDGFNRVEKVMHALSSDGLSVGPTIIDDTTTYRFVTIADRQGHAPQAILNALDEVGFMYHSDEKVPGNHNSPILKYLGSVGVGPAAYIFHTFEDLAAK
jgi:hypothetical protein